MDPNSKHIVETTVNTINFDVSASNFSEIDQLLSSNEDRIGFIIYNNSATSIYITFSNEAAGPDKFTTIVGAETEYTFLPADRCYKGDVTYNPVVAGSGVIAVTELTLKKKRVRNEPVS
jgi:hypothetical protein